MLQRRLFMSRKFISFMFDKIMMQGVDNIHALKLVSTRQKYSHTHTVTESCVLWCSDIFQRVETLSECLLVPFHRVTS